MTRKPRLRNEHIELLHATAKQRIGEAHDQAADVGNLPGFVETPLSMSARFFRPRTPGLEVLLQQSIFKPTLVNPEDSQRWPEVIRLWTERTDVAVNDFIADSDIYIEQYEILADWERGLYHAAIVSAMPPNFKDVDIPRVASRTKREDYAEYHHNLNISEIGELTVMLSNLLLTAPTAWQQRASQ